MLMLLDSAGLYYRAFHGVPESITAPDGTPVNAVRGFLDMCTALVASRHPSGLVACWDNDWRPQWRVDLLASYKAHRVAADGAEDEPEALGVQVGSTRQTPECDDLDPSCGPVASTHVILDITGYYVPVGS